MVLRLILSLILVLGLSPSCAPKREKFSSPPSSDTLRLVLGSCNDQTGSSTHWNQIRDLNPSLLILMGDNVYPETNEDLVALEKAYQELDQNPEFQKLKQYIPILATWDDHDYGKNDGGAEFSGKRKSKQLFLDFFHEPLDSERRDRAGLYDAVVVGEAGRRLQIILLDLRSFRSPYEQKTEREPGTGPYQASSDPQKTFLGRMQWQWLRTQLQEPAEFRVLVSSIQLSSSEHGWETWSLFPQEKQKLFDLIQETQAENLVIISGDRHHASLWRNRVSELYPLYELTSSSLNRPLPVPFQKPSKERNQISPLIFEPNFGMIEIDWRRRAFELLIFHSETGEILASKRESLRRLDF